MMKSHSRFLLAVVFVLGCLTSRVARDIDSPPAARAQTVEATGAAAGPKWQYGCTTLGILDSRDKDEVMQKLNTWGDLGWELVTVSDDPSGTSMYCLKHAL